MLQKKYEDYLDQVHSKYPDIDKESIRGIIEHGLKKLYSLIKEGSDIFLRVRKEFMFIGNPIAPSLNQWNISKLKEHNKLRRLSLDRKEIWDGFHYFSLTEEEYNELQEQSMIVSMYKIKKECSIRKGVKYIFKIDLEYTVEANKVPWREERKIFLGYGELIETKV